MPAEADASGRRRGAGQGVGAGSQAPPPCSGGPGRAVGLPLISGRACRACLCTPILPRRGLLTAASLLACSVPHARVGGPVAAAGRKCNQAEPPSALDSGNVRCVWGGGAPHCAVLGRAHIHDAKAKLVQAVHAWLEHWPLAAADGGGGTWRHVCYVPGCAAYENQEHAFGQ